MLQSKYIFFEFQFYVLFVFISVKYHHKYIMYIHLHTIHTEYIDIQMKPNASLKKLIAFLPFLPFHPCKPYFINIYTHPSLLLIKLMSVKMFVVWQIYIIEHYRKMLPNRFYFCYDNDVIFMNTSHISRYIVYRFIFCP